MARILQVNCDSPVCYNMIEIVDDEDFKFLDEVLAEFGWHVIDGADICPECSDEEDEEEDYSFCTP